MESLPPLPMERLMNLQFTEEERPRVGLTMSEVEWRELRTEPGYFVSTAGGVKGPRGVMDVIENYAGYVVVNIRKRQFRVSRLVCMTFHGPPPSKKHQAAHRDGKRNNNREDNLEWKLPLANSADMQVHGTTLKGERVNTAKLSPDEVREIRAKYCAGKSFMQITCEMRKVTYAMVRRIALRQAWTHIQ